MADTPQSKSAFIAIVGRPNVGKSSLLNALVAGKVAIVSDKPQTTRNRIIGVLTEGETQLVFIDTPGLHKPRTRLGEFMVGQVRESITDVDVAVLVTDTMGFIARDEQALMDQLAASGIPAILVINKIDLLENKRDLLSLISKFSDAFSFDAVFPISVLQNDGVSALLPELKKYAAEAPHFFPDDALTDQPERVMASEILREKMLRNLFDELPHGVAIGIERFSEREGGGMLDIHAVIYCERAGHKGMIIGKGGAMLKKIASEARAEMEAFFGVKINLQCWVKVKDDWRNDERALRSLGYQ